MKRNLRWSIAILIAIGTLINYFDRSNISVAMDPMSRNFGISMGQMGILLSSFSWSYAILQIPVGIILDKIGVKWVVRAGTFIWTVACILTAIAGGMGLVIFSRILLGVGESPIFPANSKATGYWFPISERGIATVSFDVTSKLANVIGVPLVALAVTSWGWRGGFYFTALLSLVYSLIFWFWYRDPKEKKGLSKEEYEYILEGGAQEPGQSQGSIWGNFGMVLKQKKTWGLCLGFAAYNYSFYLFLTWLPGYLEKQMHMTVLKSGVYALIPWLVGTITDIVFGGLLVDKLIRKGRNPSKVRKTILIIGMLFGLAVIGAAFTNNPNWAIVWISIALGGLAIVPSICWSIPSLIAPKGTVASVGSFMNFIGNLMGIAAPILTGFIAGGTGSFATGFILAAIVLVIGILSVIFLLGKIEPLKSSLTTTQLENKRSSL